MIYRTEKTGNYTVIDNDYLRNQNLSLKAKGLLTLMLSLPEDWRFSTVGLSLIMKESKNTIQAILKELEDNNYLERYKARDQRGRFLYWGYNVFERPVTSPYPNNPDMDFPDMDFQPQLNTNKQNTNNQDKIDKALRGLNNLTKELIRRNFISEEDLDIVRYNSFLEEVKDQYDYYTIIVALNYTISVMRDKTLDENNQPILDRTAYFKASLLDNLEKLTRN